MVLISALSGGPSVAPAEMEDFDVEVKASEETVRAGEPFSVTCVAPTGLGFQQQWLHPKKQARMQPFPFLCVSEFQFSLLYGFIPLSCLSCTISFNPLSCFHVISYPAALSLKLANNGFGSKPSSGKWNIALRMALSGYKVCVRKAVTECYVFIMRTVSQTALAAVNPMRETDVEVKVQHKWLGGRRRSKRRGKIG